MPDDAFRFVVNGTEVDVRTPPTCSLLSVLREHLGLTGAKYGCGEGACGACSVLVDGAVTHACVLAVRDVAGRSVTTVEGLAPHARLHPVQRAFVELGAGQCGFCIPGMVVAASALLESNPQPDEAQIASALEPNICRCCAYTRIVAAVRLAARCDAVDAPEAGTAALLARPRAPWDLAEVSERDYFGTLGDGLVVVVPPEPAGPGMWSSTGGAWLHVGGDSIATAFTGKVEVGQGTRGALRILVGQELRMPLSDVQVVMGDTDVCPFDIGTFGSRSMPTAAQELRAAAAAARRALRGLGASDHTEYARVLAGRREIELAPRDTGVTPANEWQPVPRPALDADAVATVTGARRFPSDITRPGLMFGKMLRPPSLGARLRAVDVQGARAPANAVVHDGDFVGVAAPGIMEAQRAIDAVVADWELEAMPPEAELAGYLRSHPVDTEGWGGAFTHEAGDVDAALAAAAITLEQTYTAAYIAHAPLETRVAVAEWSDGRLTVWTGTQQPFNTRRAIAAALDLDERSVRVIVPDTGGGFGGKHEPQVSIEAARLAREAGTPVQVRWTREEEFTRAYFRPAAVIDVRAGSSSDGDITAWEFTNTNAGSAAILPPYIIPNQRVRFQPAASPLRQGAYRALAATTNHFARESFVDELAHALRIDPLELRLRHLDDDRLVTAFRFAASCFGWAGRPSDAGYGAGIAGGVEKGGRVATCVEVRAPDAGHVEVLRVVTAFECGAIVDEDNLRQQVEGATIMGLGAALFEAVHFDDGHILNPRFSEYRVPRFADVPPIEVVLIDRPDLPSAGGGETPIVGIAPAIANAIFAATGTRLRSIPLLA